MSFCPPESRGLPLSGAHPNLAFGVPAIGIAAGARFLVNTGLRISQCCALTWDRVFLGEDGPSYIFIDRGKSKKARRCIPLTEVRGSNRR